ncbi:MAG: response regulator, partial [Anaerolineae bacterium]
MTESQLIHVLLVSGRDQVSDGLMSTLRSEAGVVLAGTLPSLERASGLIGQRKIDVILLDTSVPDAKQLDRLQAIAATPMSPALILMIDPNEMAFLQQALFAGARGFLLKPFTTAQLLESLRQTFDIVAQQRQALSAVATAKRDESADIFAVYSPKGGVGRTSLATNLAVALHQERHKRVTLVDGDLQFGDVDIAVNVMARKSIADLLGYVNDLEPSLVESALIDHSSGIRLLLAPPYFDPALEMEEGQLAHVVKTLAAAQDGYVVVDAPAGLGESTLNLLDIARRVLLVTAASVASLRSTKHFLELAAK